LNAQLRGKECLKETAGGQQEVGFSLPPNEERNRLVSHEKGGTTLNHGRIVPNAARQKY
jgi:hypothetical protein